jgi:hypothetical protein
MKMKRVQVFNASISEIFAPQKMIYFVLDPKPDSNPEFRKMAA